MQHEGSHSNADDLTQRKREINVLFVIFHASLILILIYSRYK